MADLHLSAVWASIQAAHVAIKAALNNDEVVDGRLCSAMPAIRDLAEVCNAAVAHDAEAFYAAIRSLHEEPSDAG